MRARSCASCAVFEERADPESTADPDRGFEMVADGVYSYEIPPVVFAETG